MGLAYELPLLGADRRDFLVVEQQQLVVRGRCLAGEDRANVGPVDFHSGGQRHPGHAAERRHEVDPHRDGVRATTRGDGAGHPRDERHPVAAVITCAALAVAQVPRRTLEPRPVIRGQDHQRIALESQLAQSGFEPPDDAVDLLDHIAICACARMVVERRVGIVGQMRRAQRQQQEERLGRILAHEFLGAVVETLLKLRKRHVFLDQLHARAVVGVERHGLHIVAVWQPEKQIEAVLGRRPERRDMAQMPFADQRAGIPRGLQRLGNRHFAQRQSARVAGLDHLPAKPGAHRISPGQIASARRGADVGGRVEIGQRHPAAGHAVDVWGADRGSAHRADAP